MLKIIYPVCCGLDVHKFFLVSCIAPTNEHGVTYLYKQTFPFFQGIYSAVLLGLLRTIARMSACTRLKKLRCMKAINEEVPAVVDGENCIEQVEKL
jgi:hypothetical protein